MKKIVICSIPMKETVDPVIYASDDRSVQVSGRQVRYPINALLESVVIPGDDLKVILLVKSDKYSFCDKHLSEFKEEILHAVPSSSINLSFIVLETEFSQKRVVHEQLMGKLVEAIDEDSHILVDTTFGSKDIPVVIFAALSFAEKFLHCEIDNIIYGQASFEEGKAVNTKICDMSPLYYLSSVTNTIRCDNPNKARKALNTLLSL